MTAAVQTVFQADYKTSRSAWQALKESHRQVFWVSCSKLKRDFHVLLGKWDYIFIYQELEPAALLDVIDVLMNRVLLPAVAACKPVSFFSRIPRELYCPQFSSDHLHHDLKLVYQNLLLEQFCNYLDNPGMNDTGRQPKPVTKFNLDADMDGAQQQAIQHLSGPIRVLAPAGSGKTKTLVNRVIHLVNEGVAPNHILALAFNKKAAQEMADRLLLRNIGVAQTMEDPGVTVRTFHGLGYEIIRRQLGWHFSADNGDKICRELLRRAAEAVLKLPVLRNQDPTAGLSASLSRAKTDLLSWTEMKTEINGEPFPFKDIFQKFLQIQIKQQYLGFDDMIYWPLRLLLDRPLLRKEIQQRFHFLLIDEFQDLNRSQLLFMQLLSLPHNNLFVVGDDDQMIYGWRGADVQTILNFSEYYGDAETHTLETNYRSTQCIIHHSKWLIQNNRRRVTKNIMPTPQAPVGEFSVELQSTLWAQAKKAVEWMIKQHRERQSDWSRFAVLYRYHVFQYLLAVLLDSYKIPHTFVQGANLLQTMVGRDLFSYLTVLFYPESATVKDFSRVLKRPNKFLTNSLIQTITSWDALCHAGHSENVSERERLILEDWLRNARSLQRVCQNPIPVPNLLRTLSSIFELDVFYQSQRSSYAAIDEAGQEIVLDVIFEVSASSASLDDFYKELLQALQDDRPFEKKPEPVVPGVTLSTIHASKGREFSHVVLFNLADNYRVNSLVELEEERRVAYVGVTRAIETLLITAPNESFSDFLMEVTLNPALAELSNSMLDKRIAESIPILQQWQEVEKKRGTLKKKKNGFWGCTSTDQLQKKLTEMQEEQKLRRLFTIAGRKK
jgi:DNA helicase II / ATP-dependent DNA helicase PcrA